MAPLLVLMVALLSVGVFIENFARTRGFRVADQARASAEPLVAVWRTRLADGVRSEYNSDLSALFQLPRAVRLSKWVSVALAGLNVALFGLVLLALRGGAIKWWPWDWSVDLTIGLVLVLAHAVVAVLSYRGAVQVERELNGARIVFGDKLVSSLRAELIGTPTPLNSPSKDDAPGGKRRSHGRAPIDNLWLDEEVPQSVAALIPVLLFLTRGGFLSASGMSEAKSMLALGYLDRRLMADSDGHYSSHWEDSTQRLAHVLSESAPSAGHLIIRWLSAAREAELLARGTVAAFSHVPEPETKRNALLQVSVLSLDRAASEINRRSTIPPIRAFPELTTSWVDAARSNRPNDHWLTERASNARGFGLLLVRAAQMDTPDRRSGWLERTAAVSGAHARGEELIASLAQQLIWDETDAYDERLHRLRALAIRHASETRHLVDPGLPVTLAQVQALGAAGMHEEAASCLRRSIVNWVDTPFSLLVAVHYCTSRFVYPDWKTLKEALFGGLRDLHTGGELSDSPAERLAVSWMARAADACEVNHLVGRSSATALGLRWMAFSAFSALIFELPFLGKHGPVPDGLRDSDLALADSAIRRATTPDNSIVRALAELRASWFAAT
ncbi:hypothetical protein [Microbacterium sp. NPDC056736]|uniref:hypothetical protein n=1 Tax=Microbacterium sp. NPDC056736 TaxID=3345932 RepID=UPI003672658D